MPPENQQPQTPPTPQVQPPATPPPSPPPPGEKRRISTATANAPEPGQEGQSPGQSPPQRDAKGHFIKIQPSGTPPAAPIAPAPVAPAAAVTPPPPPAPAQPPATPPVQPAAGQPAAPPPPKHPVWLSELAKTVGFTPEQIDRLDTNALGEGVRFAQARFVQQPVQPQQPATPAHAPAPPPAQPAFDLGLTEEQKADLGPELLAVLTKVGQQTTEKAAALEQRLAQYESREVQRTQQELYSTVDMAIAGLPPEYQAIIGAGPGLETMATAPEVHERRIFVLQALERADPSVWNKPASEIQARIKAKMASHWGITQAAPSKPVVTREEWNRAGSPPPTQRTGHDNLPAREGRKPEDSFQEQLTEEELEDQHILNSLRRRKQPQPAT